MVEVPKTIISLNTLSTIALLLLIVGVYTGYARVDINPQKDIFQEKAVSDQFTITRDMADVLNQAYSETDREIAACIKPEQVIERYGSDIKVSYDIYSFETPLKTFEEGYSEMDYCGQGVIHSHPKGSCYFSLSDIHSFQERIKKGEYFSVLMCGEDQFIYITRNDFEEKKLEIL